jgi:hypothetical protein
MQCVHDELSRVRKCIFKAIPGLTPFGSYGLSEGSPCERGLLSRLLRVAVKLTSLYRSQDRCADSIGLLDVTS